MNNELNILKNYKQNVFIFFFLGENEANERDERGLIGSSLGAVGTGVGLAANGVWTVFGGIGKGN